MFKDRLPRTLLAQSGSQVTTDTTSTSPGFRARLPRSLPLLPSPPSPLASAPPVGQASGLVPGSRAHRNTVPVSPSASYLAQTASSSSGSDADVFDWANVSSALVEEGWLSESFKWDSVNGDGTLAVELGGALARKVQDFEADKRSSKGKGSQNGLYLPKARDDGFSIDFSLTPEGDIPVDSFIEPGDFNELLAPYATQPHSERLSPSFSASVKRNVLPFLVTPFPPIASELSFPAEDLQQRALVFFNTVTPSTVAYFGTHVARYLEFCEDRQIPLDQRFPARSETLAMFLCSLATRVAGATIRKYKDGLAFWHSVHRVPFSLDPIEWKRILKGATNLEPEKKEPRPPATFVDLLLIRENLDLDSPEGACLWAAASVAFFAMARPGDVTLKKLDALDITRDPDGRDIRFVGATKDFPEYAVINLPYDKVAGKVGDTLTVVGQNEDSRLDPIQALRRHVEINKPGPFDFLFSSIPRDSATPAVLWPLTYSHFTKTINNILASAKRPQLNGHSWRIGGATFYLLADVHPDFIKVVGRWRSDAFLRYWRKTKILAAKNLTDAQLVDVGDANEDRLTVPGASES